jgi:hypothetical protein
MARIPENPDRNVSASGEPKETESTKRSADKRDDIAMYEDAALLRSGRLISSAVLNTNKRRRRR